MVESALSESARPSSGWAVYEFVFRNYGPGTVSGSLLNASPAAAAAAGIAWLLTTGVLAMGGIALVHLFARR